MSKAQSLAKRGEKNPHATLTDTQVLDLRREARAAKKDGYGWLSALARKWGISPGTLADYISGRRRKN